MQHREVFGSPYVLGAALALGILGQGISTYQQIYYPVPFRTFRKVPVTEIEVELSRRIDVGWSLARAALVFTLLGLALAVLSSLERTHQRRFGKAVVIINLVFFLVVLLTYDGLGQPPS